jgi:hypothetical protein
MRRRRSLLLPLVAVPAALALAGCGGSGGGVSLPTLQPAVVVPPRGAVVDAREWGSRDVALARKAGVATVDVVDSQGHGIDGLTVRIGGAKAAPCGTGCYRAPDPQGPVTVGIGKRSWTFTISADAPSGKAIVAQAERAYARLKTVALEQRLASGPGNAVVTLFEFQAPDRLRYTNVGGSQAIVIGSSRWDRPTTHDPWTRSPQQRVNVMHPPWRQPIDEHVVAPNTVTFFDLNTRAWFRVVVEPASKLPTTVGMTGISHFMTDRFSRFDAPLDIAPPPHG